MNAPRKYTDPAVIAKLSNMEMRARFVVEGFITGLHKSPYHGFSVEFAQHRQYMPGDEIRRIDWKVYGRTGRHYVKQYEEETNLKAYIVVDASASMTFQYEKRITKLDYACYLASALSYLMIKQRDAVGLTIFDDQIRKFLHPKSTPSYLNNILEELQRIESHGETEIGKTLHLLADRIKRRGLIIVISDLFDDPEKVIGGLKHFRHKQNEVIVFQVLDPVERSFAFGGDVIFEDLETKERLQTQPWHIQKSYQDQMHGFLEHYKTKCREHQIDYVLLDTKTDFDVALFEYLNTRKKIGG